MSRDFKIYLEDMILAAQKVLRYTAGFSHDQFANDEKTFDAVIRNLEIVGEAAKRIPPEVRERYSQVEWRQTAGLRDVVIHQYSAVDEDIIWDVVQNHLPALLTQLQQILTAENATGSASD